MDNYKLYPECPPDPPETKSKFDSLPLLFRIPIYFFMIIISIPAFALAYFFSMPIERIIYSLSGYSKLYPKYYWLITFTTHYKIFRRYSKTYFAYNPHFNNKVLYVYEKNNILNFVLTDFGGMYYWGKSNDWVITGGHGSVGFAAFYAMEQYANLQYPNQNKQYFICLSNRDIKRKLKEKDPRFIEIKDISNFI